MAHYHDQKPSFARQRPSKSGQGVRGNVAYRNLSDSYAGDKNYSRGLYIGVNAALAIFALAVLLLLLLIFTPLGDRWQALQDEAEILYTLEFYDVNGDLGAAPAQGTLLIDPKTGNTMGEIVAITSRPYTLPSSFLRGGETQAGESEHASAKIVSVTVAICAEYEEGIGYSVSGTRIAKGGSYTVSFAGSLATGTCVSIEKRW
ncbi:MAG: hypothetical protein IKA46_05485 [Clostridia bacterium]|nr:hypothetical protein [Clostridia bacterium]MBR3862435.1 hypothetical protein [Clostridia bacterium]